MSFEPSLLSSAFCQWDKESQWMYRFLIGSLLQNKQHDNKKKDLFNVIFSTKKNNVPLYLSHEKNPTFLWWTHLFLYCTII